MYETKSHVFSLFGDFFAKKLVVLKNMRTFAPQKAQSHAQMAESVDALVSNTSGFTSIPVRPRVWVPRKPLNQLIRGLYIISI